MSTVNANFHPCLQEAKFRRNFGEGGFFAIVLDRWLKWMARHQHLPLAVARLACPTFHTGAWAGSKKSFEHAVGAEFARAFASVLWPEQFVHESRTSYERRCRIILKRDLAGAKSVKEKDELTLGLFSAFDGNKDLRDQLFKYASSAEGKVERGEHAAKGVSRFPTLTEFPLLYRELCVRIYIAPVHQQLVESFFSKFSVCSRVSDSPELDRVRTGQYKSAESAHICSSDAQPREIREAAKAALENARTAKKELHSTVPLARSQRKRPVDSRTVLQDVQNLKKPKASLL